MCNHLPKAVQVSLPPEGGGPRSGGRSFLHPPPTNYSFKFQFAESLGSQAMLPHQVRAAVKRRPQHIVIHR